MPRNETERRLPLSLLFGGFEALAAALLILALSILGFHPVGRPGVADDRRSGQTSGALAESPIPPQMVP